MHPEAVCERLEQMGILLPVVYHYFLAKDTAQLELRKVRSSAYHQTQKFLVPHFYKNISRCLSL